MLNHLVRLRALPFIMASLPALLGTAAYAQEQQSPWKAGLAQVKITPQKPLHLSGYASRNKPFEAVENDLYAKALALEDPAGHRALLITADHLGFQAHVAEPICERIGQQHQLQRQQMLLNASHTHTGPSLNVGARSPMSEEDRQNTLAYVAWLQDAIVALADEAFQNLAPAKLSRGEGVAVFVMNRREFTTTGVRLGVNPRGHVDRSVPVLRIDAPDGKLRGVVFGTACHNTTLTGNHYIVSGDYAGFAQEHVQDRHAGVVAMFMQNCGGDANPYPRGELEHARVHGAELGAEVCRVLGEKLTPVAGPLRTELATIDLPLQPPPDRQQLERLKELRGGWERSSAERMLDLIEQGKPIPTAYSAPIGVWQLGEDLTLVALPGETVVDYVRLVEQAIGPRRLWVAGYCNDNFGYLPSAKVLQEGGYETRGLIYGGIGFFSPKAQDLVIATVTRLANSAGRPEQPANPSQ